MAEIEAGSRQPSRTWPVHFVDFLKRKVYSHCDLEYSDTMSTVATVRPRILRPNLSLRYQWLRRAESNAASHIPKAKPDAPASTGFLRRNRSAILWASLSLTLGAVGGQFVVHTIAPPPLPEPWSREDGILMADLNKRIDEDFKVKILRGKCLGVSKALKGDESGWVEVVPLPIDFSEKRDPTHNLVAQLEGAKGLGVERLFWDRRERKLVAVVWFGGSLCGWPGVTHGGAIATQLAEKLSMAAALADGSSNDVRAAATPQRLPGVGNHAKMLAPGSTPAEPAQMSLNYVKPTFANNFYVVRVAPAIPLDEKPDAVQPLDVHGGPEWEATLETLDAKTCVTAKARFAPSTSVQRTEASLARGARRSYADFKQWMWPSRQEGSQLG